MNKYIEKYLKDAEIVINKGKNQIVKNLSYIFQKSFKKLLTNIQVMW